MVLCPRCGSPKLEQRIVFSHPDGTVREQTWVCCVDGCGWEGTNPNRTAKAGLLAKLVEGVKVERFTEAMRDLQASGDLVLVSDDVMEIIA